MEKFCDVRLVTFFSDVVTMTSLKLRHSRFLNYDCVIISLKNHNLAKSRNSKSPKSKIKGRLGRRSPALGDF